MLSHIVVAIALTAASGDVMAQLLAPTEQTSFTFPANGAGVTIPFPPDLAQLTGLTDWPARWVTPPFTPNMQQTYNPSATTIIPDIITPPAAQG